MHPVNRFGNLDRSQYRNEQYRNEQYRNEQGRSPGLRTGRSAAGYEHRRLREAGP
jgi:hypothetical protein